MATYAPAAPVIDARSGADLPGRRHFVTELPITAVGGPREQGRPRVANALFANRAENQSREATEPA
jgi:hypothetical protein